MTSINVPLSNKTVDVCIIDTTLRIINGRPAAFMSPAIKGFDRMNALAYSFLITHQDSKGKKKKFLFDLGAPKDWKNDLPPNIAQSVKKWEQAGIKVEVKHYLSDILKDSRIPLEEIEALIWRYGLLFRSLTEATHYFVVILIGTTSAVHLFSHRRPNS